MPPRRDKHRNLGLAAEVLATRSANDAAALWSEELDLRLSALPNRVRSGLDRSPAGAPIALAVAEAAWALVIDAVDALAQLTAPPSVRDVTYNLAALRLVREGHSPRATVASQALLVAAYRIAGPHAGETLDDATALSLSIALCGLEHVAAFAAEAGTAAEFISTTPPLIHATLRRNGGHIPTLDVEPAGFDLHAWNESIAKRGSYSRRDDITHRFHEHLLSLWSDHASQYAAVDDRVFEVYGFRLIDVFVIFDECVRTGGTSPSEPRVVTTASLADALAADGNPDRRLAAIAILTWTNKPDETWRPWSMIEDPWRLSIRPLLPVASDAGDAVLFAPTAARAAASVWNDRLAEGIWPLRSYDGSDEGGLRQPWAQVARQVDQIFERQVANELQRSGISEADIVMNIETEGDLYGGPMTRLDAGELDVLALHRPTQRVLVLEAKHSDLKFRPRDIAALLNNTFIGRGQKRSRVEQAGRKVALVRRHLHDVLSRRGIRDADGWTVHGAIVTTYGSPLVAWTGPSELPVVFVEEISELLQP